ncbi:MAG: TlpA family protein disulfide reductase [Syntrophobacteraceae bacterium]|jgi:thiol-disulfide isomerase/thioredoxin|nr:TlpA family protein disulfide reductase [Syntrophobacteraceae bacterium]
MNAAQKVCSLLFCLVVLAALPVRAAEVGDSIPEFTFRAFDGSQASRASVAGRPVVVIFWNTWCPNCMKELPRVNRLHEQYGPKGVAFLAVNTALNDSESRARAYWEKAGHAFQGGFDRYFEIGQAFGVFAVPTVFLVDAGGVVLYKQAKLPEDIEERLGQLTRRD